MSNPYYAPSGTPSTGAQGASSDIRSEFSLIETGMDKLPALTAGFIIQVNTGGTALESVASIGVSRGGTGAITLTDGGILLGSGTGAITALAVLADGEMIVGDGTTDPAIESGSTLRTSIGVGTGDTPTFTGIVVQGNNATTDAISDTNTKLGVGAGDVIASGGLNNTAFGNDALGAVTTGDKCTAVGGKALLVNTASENTAVGFFALAANTSGTNNTAMGINALSTISTGGNCTAVGRNALVLNTGSDNTAVGSSALDRNSSGSSNTAVGTNALSFISTTNNCTAVGKDSLVAATGDGNTCLGAFAGDAIVAGSDNICIGFGPDTGSASSNNRIVIGVGIFGTANNQFSLGKVSNVVSNDFGTDAVWTRSSDERRKQEVNPLGLGLSFINDLEPVTYKWKSADQYPKEWGIDPKTEIDTDIIMTGMLAQQVKKALDNADTGIRFPGWQEQENGMQQISGEMFIFPLINAINELTARLKVLEGE